MSITEIYLLAMMMIFAVPYLVWRLLNSDNVAPLVVVQIVGGVLLGPGVLGAAYPEYHAFVFSPQVTLALNGIAWWAVMVFVWIAGVELDLRQAWRWSRRCCLAWAWHWCCWAGSPTGSAHAPIPGNSSPAWAWAAR